MALVWIAPARAQGDPQRVDARLANLLIARGKYRLHTPSPEESAGKAPRAGNPASEDAPGEAILEAPASQEVPAGAEEAPKPTRRHRRKDLEAED